jgi:hypothetical protein
MAQDDSIRQLIRDAKAKSRAEIEKEVWDALPFKVQERLGHAQLRRLIAAELNDPDQFEFTIDGEPYAIEDVPIEFLLQRGYRLIKAGKESIKRGEAYVEEAKARRDASEKGTA